MGNPSLYNHSYPAAISILLLYIHNQSLVVCYHANAAVLWARLQKQSSTVLGTGQKEGEEVWQAIRLRIRIE